MNKIYAIFGGLSGIFSSFFLYIYYQKELYTLRENNLLFRSFSIFTLGICVAFAIIAVKKINGNTISFVRSMFTGFMVSFLSAIVSFVFYTIIYFNSGQILIKPEAIAKDQFVKNAEIAKDSTINMAQAFESIHQQFTPGGFLLPNLFTSLIFGILVSVFVTAFVYTRTPRQA